MLMLMFTTYGNSAYARLTKTSDVKIQLAAAANNTTIKQEQHNNRSTPFVFASPSSLKNPSSSLSSTSSFNNNYQSLQPSPIANAGPDQVVTAGSTVILNGSNSRAPNGIILAYSWKQIPTSTLSNLSAVNTPVWQFIAPNVTADTPLRFQLNVTDNLGQVGTTLINVLDKPAPTIIAPPHTQIVKSPPSTSATVPSNNPNRGSNSANIPTNNASIPPPLTPPINQGNTR
jgi:hypothetical protein